MSKQLEIEDVDDESYYLREIRNLEKQLAIAIKALKKYADKDKWSYCSEDIDYFYSTKPGYREAEKALEEMEGVK